MKTRPMLEIPVSAAQEIADRYGYDQVIIIARRVGDEPDPHGEHVTTYGRDKSHCGMAARVGNFIKHKIMGWPEYEPEDKARDADGDAFRTAASLGLTLRFYGNCAQSGMPGAPSVYEVVAGLDRAAAMREAIQRADAAIGSYVASKLGDSHIHVVRDAPQTAVASAEDEPWPKRGDLVRYADGVTALALHGEPHATGWHGIQCMGGNTFYTKTYRPTEADRWQWVESAIRYRGRTLEEARAEAGIPPGATQPGVTA